MTPEELERIERDFESECECNVGETARITMADGRELIEAIKRLQHDRRQLESQVEQLLRVQRSISDALGTRGR